VAGNRSGRADARPCHGSKGTFRSTPAEWPRPGDRRGGGRGQRLDLRRP
jgi:hypothetical protein